MTNTYFNGRVEIVRADITKEGVDIIVNAANGALCGGGGVDGAIHRAAGPELLAECRTLGGAKPGEVKVTFGYLLPARFVAHVVGPVWDGGSKNEEGVLARCYRGSFAALAERRLTSIAFPSISTGAYKFPIEKAARIALQETREFLSHDAGIRRVVFCCFTDGELRVYEKTARAVVGSENP